MDIYCPACGKKGRIDDAKIPDSGIFARCPGCRKKLWINKTDGVSLAEEPSETPSVRPPLTETVPQARPEAAGGMADQPSEPATQTAPPAPGPIPASPDSARQTRPSTPPVPAPEPLPGTPPEEIPQPAAGFEISPLSTAQPQPGMGSSPGEPAHATSCSVCGNTFPDSDMIRFGDTMVCANCKPQYVQMMRSGVARKGSFRYGGFWIRFVAKVIDGIILAIAQGIVITPLIIFVFKSAMATPDSANLSGFVTANVFINFLSIALGATYTTIFIGKYQATPGKMAFGLKIVAPDGGRISYLRAFGRHFAEMVSAFTLGIGYIMAGFDSQKRALHDRIASTRVIRA